MQKLQFRHNCHVYMATNYCSKYTHNNLYLIYFIVLYIFNYVLIKYNIFYFFFVRAVVLTIQLDN